MEITNTNIKKVRISRSNALKVINLGILSRFQLACPGDIIPVGALTLAQANRVIDKCPIDVEVEPGAWVTVGLSDRATLNAVYGEGEDRILIDERTLTDNKSEEAVEPEVEETVEEAVEEETHEGEEQCETVEEPETEPEHVDTIAEAMAAEAEEFADAYEEEASVEEEAAVEAKEEVNAVEVEESEEKEDTETTNSSDEVVRRSTSTYYKSKKKKH